MPRLTSTRVVAACFAGLILAGLVLYRDYGISWDEPTQRRIGGVSVRYVLQTLLPGRPLPVTLPDMGLAGFNDRDYGVVFEAPAVAVELLLGLDDSRTIYMTRHLLTFLVFVGGVAALYRMASRRFGDWRVGLLAAAFLVLSPRFFAEAFYNSKDIVFMALFAVAMNTMFAFVLHPSRSSALRHALATAAAIDLRVVAIILVPLTIGLVAIRALKGATASRAGLLLSALFLVATAALVVAMFPWLWADPVGRFVEVVGNMSNFDRFADRVLYLGASVLPDDLPWHYLPVWVAISTPLVQLTFFLVGALTVLGTMVWRHARLWVTDEEMQDAVCLALVVAMLVAIVALDSIVYDGWRHVYFLYPAILMVALRGWVAVADLVRLRGGMRGAAIVATLLVLMPTAVWMVRVHPMQNVYFNALAGSDWRRSFDVDYWGLGNLQALEAVLARDEAPRVTIRAESATPLDVAALMLREDQRARLEVVSRDTPAMYALTNYRGLLDLDASSRVTGRQLFYELRAGREVILSVYESSVGGP